MGSSLLRDHGEVLSPLWATFPLYKIRQLHLTISRSSESAGNDPLAPNSWNLRKAGKSFPTADRKAVKKTADYNLNFFIRLGNIIYFIKINFVTIGMLNVIYRL